MELCPTDAEGVWGRRSDERPLEPGFQRPLEPGFHAQYLVAELSIAGKRNLTSQGGASSLPQLPCRGALHDTLESSRNTRSGCRLQLLLISC